MQGRFSCHKHNSYDARLTLPTLVTSTSGTDNISEAFLAYYCLIENHFKREEVGVGENAKENWALINTNPNFIWLHLNSFPSCHVVIESENPSKDIILYGAILCKSHTKYRNIKNIRVCITTCGNLKKSDKVGSVIFKNKKKVSYIKI